MHTMEVFGTDARDPRVARTYVYPARWEECTPAQLGTVAALASVPIEHEDPRQRDMLDAHLRLRLLHELTGMADAVFCRIEPTDLLDVRIDEVGAERIAFLPSLDWCVSEPLFDKSLVPTLEVAGRTWIGPNDRLGRMSLLQWGFADALLTRLSQKPSAEALNTVLAALYHPAGTVWDNNRIETHATELAELEDRVKLAAVVNYRGLRAWLSQKYRRCFRRGESDPHGLNGMVVRLAGIKFGTVDQVRTANLHDVMIHVEQSIRDQEEEKNRSKHP